ncbi:hypothetical protein HDU92_003766, partial [Lobulomyces angularis]
ELFKATQEFEKQKKSKGIGLSKLPEVVTTGKKFAKPTSKINGRKITLPDFITEKAEDISHELEASWVSLKRKELEYERLRNGEGLEDDDASFNDDSHVLVDFLRKNDDSNDDKFTSTKKKFKTSDEWVEVADEFGRTRIMRKAQAEQKNMNLLNTENGITNDTAGSAALNEEMIKEKERPGWEETKEKQEADNKHFDSKKEIRTLGVGHYQFSSDSQERAKQQLNLKKIRAETISMKKNLNSKKDAKLSAIEKRKELLKEKFMQKQLLKQQKSNKKINEKETVVEEETETLHDDIDLFLESIRSNKNNKEGEDDKEKISEKNQVDDFLDSIRMQL